MQPKTWDVLFKLHGSKFLRVKAQMITKNRQSNEMIKEMASIVFLK